MQASPFPPRPLAVFVLLTALLFAALGQVILSLDPEHAGWGFVFYGLAVLLLAMLLRAVSGQSLSRLEMRVWTLTSRVDENALAQVLLGLIGVAAILLATAISTSARPANDYIGAFWAWLLGVVFLTVGAVILPARRAFAALPARLVLERRDVAIVSGLTLLALILRLYNLGEIPYPFGGDESSVAMEAQRILQGVTTNLFSSGWQSEATLSFLPWGMFMALWRDPVVGVRLYAAVVGAASIPIVYLLGRALFNRPVGLLAAALIATMSVHIHFSRIAVNNVENPFFACLVFWLAYKAVQTRRTYWFAAAGLAGGLAMYTFVGSRLVVIVLGVYLGLVWATDRLLWRAWPKFKLLGLASLLAFLPLGMYFIAHPDIAMARVNQVGALPSGWAEAEAARTGTSILGVLANSFVSSLLISISAPAREGFYNSPGPLFDGLWSFFLVLGLIFSLLNIRQRSHWLVQLWFWSVVFFAGAMIVPPPHAERFAMMFPAVALFCALGIWNVASLLGALAGWKQELVYGVMGGAAVLLSVSGVLFYFSDYTANYYYSDPNSEVGYELGRYLGTVPRDSYVYFLGEPRMFYSFPALDYLSGHLPGTDVQIGQEARSVARPGPSVWVALPNREAELDVVRQDYPGGAFLQVVRRPRPDEVLYSVYQVTIGPSAPPTPPTADTRAYP